MHSKQELTVQGRQPIIPSFHYSTVPPFHSTVSRSIESRLPVKPSNTPQLIPIIVVESSFTSDNIVPLHDHDHRPVRRRFRLPFKLRMQFCFRTVALSCKPRIIRLIVVPTTNKTCKSHRTHGCRHVDARADTSS